MSCPGSRVRGRAGRAAAAAAVLAVSALASTPPEKTVVVSKEIRVTISGGDEIVASVQPLPGESLDAFVRRLTEDPKTKSRIKSLNGGLPRLRPGHEVRIPY